MNRSDRGKPRAKCHSSESSALIQAETKNLEEGSHGFKGTGKTMSK